MYDKAMAKNLSAMAEGLLRGPSPLSVGERELIAAYTSKVNECQFCFRSHAACAAEFLGQSVIQDVIFENYCEGMSPKLRTLCYLAGQVTLLDRESIAGCVQHAKNVGSTDKELHDTVAIASFFNMCNRYVDGLATTYKPGEEVQGGKSLAKYGYIFGVRRLVGEVIIPWLKGKR